MSEPKHQLKGWECPRCGAVNAPVVMRCDCIADRIARLITVLDSCLTEAARSHA